jgi:RNA recognition motif-containing protein
MNIFVARLDFGVTQDQLKQVFEQYGKVNKVAIATDKETGKPKGFAFVEMANNNEAEQAIKGLDGQSINGRQIAVKQAEDRNSQRKDNNTDRKPFNRDNQRQSDDHSNRKPNDYKRTSDSNDDVTPIIPPIQTANFSKAPVKKKDNNVKKLEDRPKAQKMAAYKKSGKQQKFFYDDEDDDMY